MQQAERLAGDQGAEPAHSGDIAARPVEAGDIALTHRIAAGREHDGNCFCRCHGSHCRSAASGRGDHGDPAAHKISRKRRQSILVVLGKAVFDRNIASFDIARFTQATAERCRKMRAVILP
jgi:hypothetical protein